MIIFVNNLKKDDKNYIWKEDYPKCLIKTKGKENIIGILQCLINIEKFKNLDRNELL